MERTGAPELQLPGSVDRDQIGFAVSVDVAGEGPDRPVERLAGPALDRSEPGAAGQHHKRGVIHGHVFLMLDLPAAICITVKWVVGNQGTFMEC